MAPYTYYFLFTLAAALLVPAAIFNARFALAKGKTIVGEKLTPEAPGYRKIAWLASLRGLITLSLLEVILLANLAYAIYLIVGLDNADYAKGIFIFGTISVIAIFVGILKAMSSRSQE